MNRKTIDAYDVMLGKNDYKNPTQVDTEVDKLPEKEYNKLQEVYVLHIESCDDGNIETTIEVYGTEEKARKAFDDAVAYTKEVCDYDIEDESTNYYKAYNEDLYTACYTTIALLKRDIE